MDLDIIEAIERAAKALDAAGEAVGAGLGERPRAGGDARAVAHGGGWEVERRAGRGVGWIPRPKVNAGRPDHASPRGRAPP